MLAFIFLLAALFCAMAVVRKLPVAMTAVEAGTVSLVLAMVMSSWMGFGLSSLIGYEAAPWAGIAMFGVAGGALWRGRQGLRLERLALSPLAQAVLWFAGAALAVAGFILLRNHYLLEIGGAYYSAGYTWADLALHMSLASFFTHQPDPSLAFPLFRGVQTSYPFLADFQSGFLARNGFSWTLAFLVPNAVLMFSWVVLLVALVRRLLGSVNAALLHLSFILFSGSTAAIMVFWREYAVEGAAALLKFDYSNMGDTAGLHFANLVNSHLFPQRSYLFGSAVLFLALWLFWEWRRTRTRKVLAVAGVAGGLLPLIHVHSFFVLMGVLVAVLAYRRIFERKPLVPFRDWWPLLFLLLAVPQVAWQLQTAASGEFLSVHVGWLTREDESPLVFWLRNAGAALGLAALTPLVWKKFADPTARALFVAGVTLFTLCNVFQFQPNLWDNMKFLTYAYLFLLLPGSLLVAEWLRKTWGVLPAALAIFLLVSPGLLTLNREYALRYEFLSLSDRSFADRVIAETDPEATFMISERHNHPVTTLAGRKVLLGYPGWMWSYGLDYSAYLAAEREIFAGGPDTQTLLQKYDVRYVAIDTAEKRQYGFNDAYFQANHTLKIRSGSWELYEITR